MCELAQRVNKCHTAILKSALHPSLSQTRIESNPINPLNEGWEVYKLCFAKAALARDAMYSNMVPGVPCVSIQQIPSKDPQYCLQIIRPYNTQASSCAYHNRKETQTACNTILLVQKVNSKHISTHLHVQLHVEQACFGQPVKLVNAIKKKQRIMAHNNWADKDSPQYEDNTAPWAMTPCTGACKCRSTSKTVPNTIPKHPDDVYVPQICNNTTTTQTKRRCSVAQ